MKLSSYKTPTASKALNAFTYRRKEGLWAIMFRVGKSWQVIYEDKRP